MNNSENVQKEMIELRMIKRIEKCSIYVTYSKVKQTK